MGAGGTGRRGSSPRSPAGRPPLPREAIVLGLYYLNRRHADTAGPAGSMTSGGRHGGRHGWGDDLWAGAPRLGRRTRPPRGAAPCEMTATPPRLIRPEARVPRSLPSRVG